MPVLPVGPTAAVTLLPALGPATLPHGPVEPTGNSRVRSRTLGPHGRPSQYRRADAGARKGAVARLRAGGRAHCHLRELRRLRTDLPRLPGRVHGACAAAHPALLARAPCGLPQAVVLEVRRTEVPALPR